DGRDRYGERQQLGVLVQPDLSDGRDERQHRLGHVDDQPELLRAAARFATGRDHGMDLPRGRVAVHHADRAGGVLRDEPGGAAAGRVIAPRVYDDRQRTVMVLVAAAAVLLLILPLVVTFNEAITAAVQAVGGDRLLADWIVPYESRVAAGLLMVLEIPVAVG